MSKNSESSGNYFMSHLPEFALGMIVLAGATTKFDASELVRIAQNSSLLSRETVSMVLVLLTSVAFLRSQITNSEPSPLYMNQQTPLLAPDFKMKPAVFSQDTALLQYNPRNLAQDTQRDMPASYYRDLKPIPTLIIDKTLRQ